MICRPCRGRRHQDCPGGTWCCCQHRPGTAVERPADPKPRADVIHPNGSAPPSEETR